MRLILLLIAVTVLACPALAYDLGTTAPVKPSLPDSYTPPPPRGPESPFVRLVLPTPVVGSWGNTLPGNRIENAILMQVPGAVAGSTVGYNNDYDEACPDASVKAPDIVLRVDVATSMAVDIDLCHSAYDTKVYVYDQNLNLVACNDDFHTLGPCFPNSSKIENLPLSGGLTYYIVVDGADAASGEFELNVAEHSAQAGDTILTAFAATIPGTYTGTTVGYNNNYDEICPYTGSTAPDVVYRLQPAADIRVDIDLCYSSYDTKVYMYDQNLNLVACNDDFYWATPCFTYSSKLEGVSLQGGGVYFVVIDGYGTTAGSYHMEITEFEPCVVYIPGGVQLEGEPPLVDGYQDAYNGGCNSPEFGNPFQLINGWSLAGVSGWYISPAGGATRDTDWFYKVMPPWGVLEITGDAEQQTYLFELGPQDCGSVGVIQNVIIGPCAPNTLQIYGPPNSLVWFWVGPTTFTGPPGISEYNYMLYFNYHGATKTERHSWTDVKSLFR